MNSIAVSPEVMQAQPSPAAIFPIGKKTTKSTDDVAAYEEFVEVWKKQLEQNWQGGYTQMPDEISRDPTLSPRAKHVYRALLSFMWFKTDKCFPSQQTLADTTGYSRSTIIRALRDLYERGYIERWRRGQGDTNYYFLNPLTFVRSFREPGRGAGTLLQVNAPERQAHVSTTPAPDLTISLSLSGKCHDGTCESSTMEQPDVSTWNRNQTNQTHIQLNSIPSNYSTTPSGECVVSAAIGNESQQTTPTTRTEGTNLSSTRTSQSKPNPTENQKENLPGAARAKALTAAKQGKMHTTAEAIAAATGIPAEHLNELGVAPERPRRPIPDFIAHIMTDLARDLGENPRSVKSSVTRATKIYYTALEIFTDIRDDPEGHFLRALYDAKADALKVNKIRYHTGSKPNRVPAFFACLENFFGFTPEELAWLRSDEPMYAA